MASDEVTTRWCRCDERKEAEGSGVFRPSKTWGGWWFVDMPTRVMSKQARYFAFTERAEHRHEDHTGEPFIFIECPFCGETLPEGEQRPRPTEQADGEALP